MAEMGIFRTTIGIESSVEPGRIAQLTDGGVTAPDFVVFAEPTDTALLGVRSLEGLNLRVDVARKRFVDAGPIITAALAA